MYLVDQTPRFIFVSDRKKTGLLIDGQSREAAAVESDLDCSASAPVLIPQRRKPCVDDLPRIIRRDIISPCSDLSLIAENAIVRAASVRYEYRNNRMLFQNSVFSDPLIFKLIC